jgi:hypothetical protein
VIERKHLVGEIGDHHARVAGVVVVGSIDAHAGPRYAVFTEGHAGDDAFFGERAVAIVAVELVGLRVVGEKQVRPAVVVVVENGDAHGFRGGVGEASFLRSVLEGAVAAIVPEANGGAFVGFRGAVGFAFAVERAVEVVFWRPLHVIAYYEIELAVFVVIDPRGAGAEFVRAGESGFLRDLGEGAIAVIVEQMALA